MNTHLLEMTNHDVPGLEKLSARQMEEAMVAQAKRRGYVVPAGSGVVIRHDRTRDVWTFVLVVVRATSATGAA